MPSTLCPACEKIFDHNPQPEIEYPHHSSPQEFQYAKDQGCLLCNTIWDQIPKAMDNFRMTWSREIGLNLSRSTLLFNNTGTMENREVVLWVKRIEQKDHRGISHQPSTHSNGSQLEDTYHPDRIIDVGSFNDSKIYLRLLPHIPNEEQSSRYLTLSHCWGTFQIIKLTQSTFPEFQAGIEVLSLPKTFQDAVEATRKLGERYIWIDSLCIFQDSTADWGQQSLKMDEIYSYAYCNLAATASADSRGGLFYTRSPPAIQLIQVPCKWEFEVDTDIHGGKYMQGECKVIDPTRTERAIQDGPLGSRGWVLQERLLSPRVVHFGAKQVVWECEHRTACETHPDAAPWWPSFLATKNFAAQLRQIQQKEIPAKFSTHIYKGWRDVVHCYSGLKLTYATDVLVAIGGLAQIMQDAIGDEYLAGLWRDDIACQMLWERDGMTDLKGISTCDEFIAPSWSWTSTGCTVSWETHRQEDKDIHLEYLGSQIEWIRTPTSYQLKTARLELRARIFKLRCTLKKHNFHQQQHPLNDFENWPAFFSEWSREFDNLEVFIQGEVCPAWLKLDNPNNDDVFFKLRREDPTSSAEIKFMLVAVSQVEKYVVQWHGLVVEECEGNNTYRRRGRLDIWIKKDSMLKILENADMGVEVPNLKDLLASYSTKQLGIQDDGSTSSYSSSDGKARKITLV